MSHQQKTLWTKDFTSIAIATILTAVGGGSHEPADQPFGI